MNSRIKPSSMSGRRALPPYCAAALSIFMPVAMLHGLVAEANDVDHVIEEISAAERRLQNLTVDGESTEEHPVKGEERWRQSPKTTKLTAWFNAPAGRQARVDVHKEVSGPWLDGPAPYAVMSYSVAFDGEASTRVGHWGGGLSDEGLDTSPSGSALIIPGMAREFGGGGINMASGAMFSIHFFELDGRSFSQVLAEKVSQARQVPDVYVTVERSQFRGVDALKISLGTPGLFDESWWIDPARGFSLIGYRYKQGREMKVDGEFHVVELTEAAPGIWYPLEAYYYPPPPEGTEQPEWRGHYLATRVVANDPNFDESIFDLEIPAGYRVDDRVENRRYVTPERPVQETESRSGS